MSRFKYFVDCETLEDVKKQYKKLVFIHHPDVSGYDSTEVMKQINNEYDLAFTMYKDTFKTAEGKTYNKHNDETSETYKDILNKVIHFTGVKVEVIGTWIWLTGNTIFYKEEIKALKFGWSQSKKAWYYHAEPYKKNNNKKYTLDNIRSMFGSTEIPNDPQPSLT